MRCDPAAESESLPVAVLAERRCETLTARSTCEGLMGGKSNEEGKMEEGLRIQCDVEVSRRRCKKQHC